MSLQQEDLVDIHRCDESKCVSKGNSDLYNGSFTCYGEEGNHYPMMCADGFVPVVVEDEPPFIGSGDISLQYFTCCPPDHPPPQATRHCSDPISFDAETVEDLDSLCHAELTQNITLHMKSTMENPHNAFGTMYGEIVKDSYLCCDSAPTNDYSENIFNNENDSALDATFLDKTECVPYRNEWYKPSKVRNLLGCIADVGCSLEEFPVPRPVEGESHSYQCCRSGTALPPFVQDSTFRYTTYIPLVLYSIVIVTSSIVVIGLLIPLFIQLKNGSFQDAERRGIRKPKSSTLRVSSLKRSSTLPGSGHHSSTLDASSRHSRHSRYSRHSALAKKPSFSTYNLYLVYLALPDLIYAIYEVSMYGSLINQQFSSKYYPYVVLPSSSLSPNFSPDWALFVTYKYSNMAINAIITYEVMTLLRDSKNGIKVKPPSLKRVNTQMAIVYFIALLYFLGFFFLQAAVGRAEHNGELEKKMNLFYVLSVYKLLTGFALAAYVIYLSCVVWRRNYLPPLTEMTAKQKALRELYFYFFRIVILFIAIWVPCVSLLLYANVTGRPWPILACSCAGAIQAIFTAGMILTKSDVRNYLYDFVTLSYFFNKEPEESRNSTLPTTPKAIAAGSGFTHSTVSGMKTPAHSVHHSDLDPLDQDVSASFYEESQNQNPETSKMDIADEESGSASKTESED